MMVMAILRRLNAAIEKWFTVPEARAAGRMGLYRIVFSAFYLWHLSPYFAARLAGLPAPHHRRLLLLDLIGNPTLSPLFLQVLESSLVAAIVILMVGYRVRLATGAVLILGCFYEALFFRVSVEHATTLMVAYIPLFMLIGGSWGATHSLDAVIARRAGRPTTDSTDSSWRFFLPARATLVVLAALFLSSAVFKVGFGATWLNSPGLFANIMLDKNVRAAIRDLPMNPVAPLLAQMPELADALAYLVVLFEGTFFLVLFSRKLFAYYVALALLFHSVNALWLMVTFTPILIVYGLFVDWQALRERMWPGRATLFDAVGTGWLVGGALIVAAASGILWNWGTGLRAAMTFGGALDWRTVWYPVLLGVLIWWAGQVLQAMIGCVGHSRIRKESVAARTETPV
jgi:hypothetical protein